MSEKLDGYDFCYYEEDDDSDCICSRVDGLEAENCKLLAHITEIADELNTSPEHIIEIIRGLHDRIADLEDANRWIPVAERLPDGNGFFDVSVNEGGNIYTAKHYYHTAIGWDLYYGKVTHWRAPIAQPQEREP